MHSSAPKGSANRFAARMASALLIGLAKPNASVSVPGEDQLVIRSARGRATTVCALGMVHVFTMK